MEEITFLSIKTRELSSKIGKLTDFIENAIESLRRENMDLFLRIQAINLSSLQAKEKPKQDRKFAATCKQLYRKIANLTHPDKTSVSWKHALFMKAKTACSSNSYSDLHNMLMHLENSEQPFDQQNHFEEASQCTVNIDVLSMLRLEVTRKEDFISSLERSDDYKIAVMYNSVHKKSAIVLYRLHLLKQL